MQEILVCFLHERLEIVIAPCHVGIAWTADSRTRLLPALERLGHLAELSVDRKRHEDETLGRHDELPVVDAQVLGELVEGRVVELEVRANLVAELDADLPGRGAHAIAAKRREVLVHGNVAKLLPVDRVIE